MRIPSQIYISQQQIARSNTTEDGGKAGNAGAPKTSDNDVEVSVSAAAKQLAADSATDTAKVQRLKAAIQDGSFQIDPQRIAQRIVAQE